MKAQSTEHETKISTVSFARRVFEWISQLPVVVARGVVSLLSSSEEDEVGRAAEELERRRRRDRRWGNDRRLELDEVPPGVPNGSNLWRGRALQLVEYARGLHGYESVESAVRNADVYERCFGVSVTPDAVRDAVVSEALAQLRNGSALY